MVSKLLALGKKILDIIKAAVAAGASAVRSIVKALLAAGKTLASILQAVASEALSIIQPVVDALLTAGQTIRNLLLEAAKLDGGRLPQHRPGAAGTSAGPSRNCSFEAAAAVGNTLRIIVQTLLALGWSLAQILAAIAGQLRQCREGRRRKSPARARAETGGNIVLGRREPDRATATAAFRALIALGRKVAEILSRWPVRGERVAHGSGSASRHGASRWPASSKT